MLQQLDAGHIGHLPVADDQIDHVVGRVQELLGLPVPAYHHHKLLGGEDGRRLANRDRGEKIAGARVEVAPYKKDPADFVLWKPSQDGQPGWDSPWGRGRPGWHLECSAMSKEYLGETFDIHCGGQDLIFPHHENEIAQSTCAHGGKEFVRLWMHNGHLMVEGEKMSKSLGNYYTVHDLLDEFPGEAIRLALLKTHYRQPLDFTKDGLLEAKRELDGFYAAFRKVKDVQVPSLKTVPEVQMPLEDDLNTPQALARLHKSLGALNKEDYKADIHKGYLLAGGELLGLLQQDPEHWFKWRPGGTETLDEKSIEALISERGEARAAKDFKRADEIRDGLEGQGILLEDGPEGSTWKRA
ncbi:MAG: class I tRNA ligase family protein [Proteobacteria bacterium]|nr:class I tRNA ligase family protein [Pseudomonadota bacterium]